MELIDNSLSLHRQRLTRSRAVALLAAHAESGLSTAAFAVQHGLRPQALYRWRNRLRSEQAGQSCQGPVINVTASVACEASTERAAVLTFANGMRLEHPERLSPEQLRVLCAAC